jgi:D-glycero-D-manno-heptose 1,7-bisphosphate phosphatase
VRTGRAAVADEATLGQWLAAVPGTRVHADMAAFAEHLVGAAH